ncbi:hypothetical protein WJX81_001003 [Elliptochloris bilobata]|uniref:non-specific serine/threonine protein kinase n=1 Tax=Elliptochloris bilobata TaxID=381761 RepID=A0AAW1RCM0_9CHLO
MVFSWRPPGGLRTLAILYAALLHLPGAWSGVNDTATLLAILHSITFTPPWLSQATWVGEVCSGPNTTSWLGVTCSGGRVTAVDLSGLGISGPLDGFGQLTALTDLQLARNRFSGSVPAQWASLAALQRLNLSYNSLSWSLPQAWSRMPALTSLDLSSNRFNSNLPDLWGNMSSLHTLLLANNSLQGTLPALWGTGFPSLSVLSLKLNDFTGPLPAWSRLHSLKTLDLTANRLQGPLPAEYAGLQQLEILWLSFNQLTGTQPSSWAQMPRLAYLGLNNNQLRGPLPDAWGANASWPSLQVLNLGGNELSGTLPASWLGAQGFRSLELLGLAQNRLTGTIPSPAPNCSMCTAPNMSESTSTIAAGVSTGMARAMSQSMSTQSYETLVMLAPQRAGYGVCGAVPDSLVVGVWSPGNPSPPSAGNATLADVEGNFSAFNAFTLSLAAQATMMPCASAPGPNKPLIGALVAGCAVLLVLALGTAFGAPSGKLQEEDVVIVTDATGQPRVLGEGAFGQVLLGRWRGALVAVKVLRESSVNASALEDFRQEAATLQALRHPNVLNFYGACLECKLMMVVVEYMAGGDLGSALDADALQNGHGGARRLGWYARGRVILLCVVRGLTYLHRERLVHLDLKSANVLLLDRNCLVAKIADLGVSKYLGETSLLDHTCRGTPAYMAPELLCRKGDKLSSPRAVDIFSFGVLLHEVVSGERPSCRRAMEPFRVPEECPQGVADLWRDCTSLDPAARPSAAEDCPQGVVDLWQACIARDPSSRPSAADVQAALVDLQALPPPKAKDAAAAGPVRAALKPAAVEDSAKRSLQGQAGLGQAGKACRAEDLAAAVARTGDPGRPENDSTRVGAPASPLDIKQPT